MLNNITVSLFGNPNCGKTAVFNLLTGLDQKVSNYPGITVEKKSAKININKNLIVNLEDYPGAYSLVPQSLDEKIVSDTAFKWVTSKQDKPEAIVYIADVTNLRRNLYFLTQILSFNIPVIVLLNMVDLVNLDDIVDYELLEKSLSVYKIIPFSAAKGIGLKKFKSTLENISKEIPSPKHRTINLSEDNASLINLLTEKMKSVYNTSDSLSEQLALSIFCNDSYHDDIISEPQMLININNIKEKILKNIQPEMLPHIKTMESDLRYGFIDEILLEANYKYDKNIEKITPSEKLDNILTHKWFGPMIYVAVLYFIFQSIFTWATVPMDYIDNGISYLGNYVYSIMPDNWLRDLVVDGAIAGVGAIVIFLPQILLLMLFMTLLEDSGYMTRVTFLMDKFMRKMGLHGKSILPIMSGYACAIPGIISTRTIDSWKERLITILILPLVSCSARLPVYVLMIGAFIPQIYIFNLIGLQGLVMVIMYFIGTITAFVLAKIFSKFLSEKSNPTFIMELPPYRKPLLRSVLKQVYSRGKLFLIDAGKIIMLISIILWLLVSFPKNELGEVNIDQSYAGKIGHTIEPIIEPLGFDWKIGIGLITSFAAREVMVSTLATIYNVADEGDDIVNLKEAMKNDINPKTGKNTYNSIVALSLMIFYVYAAQCMATFAIVKTETNTWKWPIFMIVYMSILAYAMSFIVYQTGMWLLAL